MSFLEPLFLIGLLAAGLPIAVHLFNRRKAVVRPFPAMHLLMQSNKRTARSIKVRQWALLALRILAVAILALALAKPFCLSEQGIAADQRMPTAVVFVVDTSASMQHNDWWSRTQKQFDKQLGRLKPWDEVSLIDTANLDDAIVNLTDDHDKVERAFARLKPTQGKHDLSRAMTRAREMLSTSQLPARRVVILSDMSIHALEETTKKPLNAFIDPITVRRKRESQPSNLSIESVSYVQEGTGQNQMWRIDAAIKNHGESTVKDIDVQLNINNEVVAAGKLDQLKPNAVATYTVRHAYKGQGVQQASVVLPDADQYALDNVFYFAFRMRDRIQALVVNGEPSSIIYDDETFFLSRALNPQRTTDRGIVPRVVNDKALSSIDLSQYDVIFLSNLPRVGVDIAQKLQTYVEQGGGVFVTLGDQVDVNAYNQTMKSLLPRPLRGLKKLADPDDPDAPVKITRLGATEPKHPIFRAFSLPGGQTLQAVQVFSYMLLEPGVADDSQTIMSFKDNAPALMERRIGKGRVLMFTSSIDNEWTDFPVRATYLPLLHRAVEYLARRATSDTKTNHVAGKRVFLEIPDTTQKRIIVQGPMHEKTPDRMVLEPQDGKVQFVPKRQGLYRVWIDQVDAKNPLTNQLVGLAFAVQADRKESALKALPEKAFEPWRPVKQKQGDAITIQTQKRVNIWPKLLFFITLLLLMETVLGTRRSVLQKLWRLITRQNPPSLEEESAQ